MKVKALKVIKSSFVAMVNAKTVSATGTQLTTLESQINGGEGQERFLISGVLEH